MRCPDCSKQTTRVRSMPQPGTGAGTVTLVLIAMNVIAYLAEGNFRGTGARGTLVGDFGLFGPAVADGEVYRVVTAGFLHAGFLHIAFNMYLLWILGGELEGLLGRARFGALYGASLLAGSFGALLLSPNALTVGASGAVFGLMGAAAAVLYSRGVNPLRTNIGLLIMFNLAFSAVAAGISLGGHLGGLIGGGTIGLAFAWSERRERSPLIGWGACAAVAVIAVAGSLAVV